MLTVLILESNMLRVHLLYLPLGWQYSYFSKPKAPTPALTPCVHCADRRGIDYARAQQQARDTGNTVSLKKSRYILQLQKLSPNR